MENTKRIWTEATGKDPHHVGCVLHKLHVEVAIPPRTQPYALDADLVGNWNVNCDCHEWRITCRELGLYREHLTFHPEAKVAKTVAEEMLAVRFRDKIKECQSLLDALKSGKES